MNLLKKMTRTQVWVKIKSYATIAPLSIFLLGKGREILTSQTLLNTLSSIVYLLTLNPYDALV